MTLRLTDGTTIGGLSTPLQGTRHRVIFGVEEASGREVAAKIELIPGALEVEGRALGWLTARRGPAPRLRALAAVEGGEHAGAACLVVDRVAGDPPTSADGWERMGAALARLSRVPWRGSGLSVLAHRDFQELHQRRAEELGEAIGSDLGASLPTTPASYAEAPLILTHGDPGPGNFLDDGAAGTLIDWEDALVAPRGLDLGRTIFIALAGSARRATWRGSPRRARRRSSPATSPRPADGHPARMRCGGG